MKRYTDEDPLEREADEAYLTFLASEEEALRQLEEQAEDETDRLVAASELSKFLDNPLVPEPHKRVALAHKDKGLVMEVSELLYDAGIAGVPDEEISWDIEWYLEDTARVLGIREATRRSKSKETPPADPRWADEAF